MKFSFNLSIGKESFIFNNKELVTSSCVKKKSPSQIRREQKRKEERSQKKATPAAEFTEEVAKASEAEDGGTLDPEVNSKEYKCSKCDSSFKSEEDLKTHIVDIHAVPNLPTPEKERSHFPNSDLNLTPVCGETREEIATGTVKACRVDVASSPSPPPDPTYFCAARGRWVKVEELWCTLVSCDTCCGNNFNCKQWRKRFLDPDLRPTLFD